MHVNWARPAFVPAEMISLSAGTPVRTSKRYVAAFLSTIGWSHASAPFLLESQNVLISGTCFPRIAGFGLGTVRAQIQAITFASPPPFASDKRTLGYKLPTAFRARSS